MLYFSYRILDQITAANANCCNCTGVVRVASFVHRDHRVMPYINTIAEPPDECQRFTGEDMSIE